MALSSIVFLTDSNPMRPATMANKHISALNPAAEKWQTVISHTEHLCSPPAYFTDQGQMLKYFSFSVPPAQTHR